MRQKTLTKQCDSCSFCIMNDKNQLCCGWGNSKSIKILNTPKRKKGYPECNLIKS
jgi:hypothetical protein